MKEFCGSLCDFLIKHTILAGDIHTSQLSFMIILSFKRWELNVVTIKDHLDTLSVPKIKYVNT